MLTKLTGGKIYDPVNAVDGEIRDLYIRDGRIVDAPTDARIDEEYDLRDKIVMAGGIDFHTHIGGGKLNLARAMSPQDREAVPATLTAGHHYARMGYTAGFEPAMLPSNARQTHMEMADTPMVDTGGYAMLGNDDFLLQMIADGESQSMINDYVAWTLRATQAIGIKTVNAGGINAFKFNARKLDVDESVPHYGVTPRAIVHSLTRALDELGVPFPLHVHASNLGAPGNIESTLSTVAAAQGHRIHLTHVQYHSYGTDGPRGFSSAAAQIAEALKRNSNLTVDVGQVMFGQTITVSADTMHQYNSHDIANPNKWSCMDIECDAGCGVVPFRYSDESFVNALQWAIGLELFLAIDDPWRVVLTTDHPNGAVFTSYPHLIRLLMDRGFRNDCLASIHPQAAKHSNLDGLTREYSLYEIAIMTRAAPARLLGLDDHGHLGAGAAADIAAYDTHDNPERMFEAAALVLKDGEPVVRNGEIIRQIGGRTHTVRPEYDARIERRLTRWFDDYHTVKLANFKICDDEMAEDIGSPVVVHPCRHARKE